MRMYRKQRTTGSLFFSPGGGGSKDTSGAAVQLRNSTLAATAYASRIVLIFCREGRDEIGGVKVIWAGRGVYGAMAGVLCWTSVFPLDAPWLIGPRMEGFKIRSPIFLELILCRVAS